MTRDPVQAVAEVSGSGQTISMKRVFDVVVSATGLLLASPILLPVMFLVWKQDGHSPSTSRRASARVASRSG